MGSLRLYGVIFIGSLVTLLLDMAMGIDFKGTPLPFQLIHKIVYLIWGSIIFVAVESR